MALKINRKKFLQLSILAPLSLMTKPMRIFSLQPNKLTSPTADAIPVIYYKPGDADYDILRKGFNKRIDKKPAIIALCNNTQGVADAINFAAKNNLPVAIKSGGHCMEGFSVNNGGMVINLSAMKKIEWIDTETVKVNPACTLQEIYDALLPKNKIIPGGSCAGVGIGGLVLGGGYGLLARKFGLTCDSLQAITMVDGTGKIQTASAGSELLWACKGGNNGNFGVVTALTFKVHQAPPTMQSFRFKSYKQTTDQVKKTMNQWFTLTAKLPDNCFSAFVQNGKTTYILLTNVGPNNDSIQKTIDGLKAVTQKFTQTQKAPLSQALKVFYGQKNPLYFKNASAGLYKNFAQIESYIDQVLNITLNTPGMIYQVNTLGGKIQSPEFEKQSAFPHRAYPFFSELQTYWESPSQQQNLLIQFQKVQDIFNKNGTTAQYRNYPDLNFNGFADLYYGNSLKKLQQIKNKYDPKNLFRYEQSLKNS